METLKGKEDKGRVKEVLRKMEMEIKEGWKGKNKGRMEGDVVAARTKKTTPVVESRLEETLTCVIVL